jgi:hypothetical protein
VNPEKDFLRGFQRKAPHTPKTRDPGNRRLAAEIARIERLFKKEKKK